MLAVVGYMNHYQPPKSNVEGIDQQPRPDKPLWIIFKASFYGSSLITCFGGIIAFIVSYPKIDVALLGLFAIYWLLSFLVSFSVTMTYGSFVNYIIKRMNIRSRIAYIVGAFIPGSIILVYGAYNDEKSAYGMAVIITVYALPISIFGHKYANKSLNLTPGGAG